MKNAFFLVLIALFVFPAFTPLMPHEGIHALHDYQTDHHSAKSHGHEHDHAAQDHDTKTQVSDHHPIHFDAATYFSDYLHVDLQSPEQVVLKAPALDSYDIEFTVVAAFEPSHWYELASVQSRAPPDWRRFRPENTPLYLSTQRLRI